MMRASEPGSKRMVALAVVRPTSWQALTSRRFTSSAGSRPALVMWTLPFFQNGLLMSVHFTRASCQGGIETKKNEGPTSDRRRSGLQMSVAFVLQNQRTGFVLVCDFVPFSAGFCPSDVGFGSGLGGCPPFAMLDRPLQGNSEGC